MATVLIGFMGAGKTSAARLLDPGGHVDTDALLEERFGKPIAEVFERDGEAAFRAAEEEVACTVLARAGADEVVALGGGSLGSAAVREALRGHVVVLLEVGAATAWERAAGAGRPLARDRERFEELWAARLPVYEDAARAFLPEGADLAAARSAWGLLRDAPPGTRMAWASAGADQYPVYVGRGILGLRAGGILGRRFLITDETVGALYAARVGDLAGAVEIPAGEAHKTLETAHRAWRALARQGATRSDAVLALGGGVVGDLAGFVAAGYQRGIPVVQVPTTIVAQVDSAYGGKTGVDLPEGKNYVGAYHQPAAVLTDTATLVTLPPEEQAAGYAEVVKTALIAGGALWDRVADGEPVDDDTIFSCARTKLAIVAADERDAGLRQVLNLGHTVGHALETVTGYQRLRHGEAVGLGLLVALTLSEQHELRARVAELLAAAGLPTTIDGVDLDAVAAATERDKKRTGDRVPFVLVRAPGDVVFGRQVGDDELRAALRELAPR